MNRPIPVKVNGYSEGSLVSCDYANNILVVKTLPGMAQAVGEIVDSLGWNDVVGTIAGDNTLMIVCRAEKIAEDLMENSHAW